MAEIGRLPAGTGGEGEEPDPYEGLTEEEIEYLNDPTRGPEVEDTHEVEEGSP